MSEEKYRPADEVVVDLVRENPQAGVEIADALYGKGNAKIPVKSIPDLEEALETAHTRLKDSDLHVPAFQATSALRGIRSQLEDAKAVEAKKSDEAASEED